MHCINYLKMFIYMNACMWNVVMCMLSKINYKKENIQHNVVIWIENKHYLEIPPTGYVFIFLFNHDYM